MRRIYWECTYKLNSLTAEIPNYSLRPAATLAQALIPRQGDSCPTGFYKSGNYCKRMSSSEKEALPKERGKKCPTGWRKSAAYCVKQ